MNRGPIEGVREDSKTGGTCATLPRSRRGMTVRGPGSGRKR